MKNRIKTIRELPDQIFKELGWEWFLGGGEWKYLTSSLVAISQRECENYYQAGNYLYDMYKVAAQYVIDNNLWQELNIPPNMIELIRLTWQDERHLHLYGRFDLAGGIEGKPIKLLEFNADTPTSLPEISIIQWAQLKANGMDEEKQFNFAYDDLVDKFRELIAANPDLEPTLLVSAMDDNPEDVNNVDVIGAAAKEAGMAVDYRFIEDVTFSPTDGIFAEEDDGSFTKYSFWFKLVPWEYIAYDEPELVDTLTQIVRNRQAVILNPAYTLIYQSKGILKYLWDLYPKHPLLLKSGFEQPSRLSPYAYVEKVMFGREGDNISIYNEFGRILAEKKGDYGQYARIYQAFAELPKDNKGFYYQPSVYYMTESNGLGFRRRKELIVDEDAEFLGHYIYD